MNSLCATGSGMSGLTSGVAISGIPAPTGLTVNNSISIPLDFDPDLVLHYPLNGDILNYGSNPTVGINNAEISGTVGETGLSSVQSIFKNGQSLNKSIFGYITSFLNIDKFDTLFVANTGGYSFSCWVYIQGITSSATMGTIWSICQDNTLQGNNYTYKITYQSVGTTTSRLFLSSSVSSTIFYDKEFFTNLVKNQWYHIVWTLNTSNQSNVYVNGTRVLTNDITIPYFSVAMKNKFLLGDVRQNAGVSDTIYGYMNDFRYYNRILDIYEVKQLYNILFNSKSKLFSLNTDISLALYYPFDSDFLNYASMVGVSDVSNNNNALISNSNLKVGSGSLSLVSSSSQYLKLNGVATNANFIPSSGGCSFSIWFRTINNQTGARLLDFGNGGTGGDARNNIMLIIEGDGITGNAITCLLYYPTGTTRSIRTVYNATVNNGDWHHVVWTMSYTVDGNRVPGSNWKIYLDGSIISNSTNNYYPLQTSRANNYIGYSFNTPLGDPLYNGFIDDYRYYKKVLSATEVTTLYNYRSTYLNTLNLNSDPSLCLYYTFDLSRNAVYNYAQNVYGTVDASYVNGAHTNYADLTYVGTGGLKLLVTNSGYVQLLPTSVVNTTNFISNNGMTFACWFYSKTSGNNAKIFDFNDTYDSYSNNIFVSMNASNSISANVYTSPTTSSTVSLATNYNNSILYHFVWTMTYSNAQTSSWNIYINATNVSNTTSKYYPNQVARGSDFLGRSNISSDPSFNGYIDDFRVYQRVLTQTEITQIYAYTNTLNVKSANLSWTAANTTKTPLTYNYFYKDNILNITPNIVSYFSGLSWTAFYGVINDYNSIASTTTANSFQTQSRYSGGSNTKISSSSNTLTNINYPYTTIASTDNIFGFDNTNGNGDNGYFISLVITGYFKPTLTGIWNFQFASAGFPNDDFSIFWINDGANVNGTTTHWPPTDINYNNYSYPTYVYSVTLFADVYYPIQITWTQASGGSTFGFQFQPPGGSYTTNGTGYFFSQSSSPVNTSSTNSVINNLLDGNGITYSVNSQVGTKQSKYVSVTK